MPSLYYRNFQHLLAKTVENSCIFFYFYFKVDSSCSFGPILRTCCIYNHADVHSRCLLFLEEFKMELSISSGLTFCLILIIPRNFYETMSCCQKCPPYQTSPCQNNFIIHKYFSENQRLLIND